MSYTGERDLQLLRQPETDEMIASYSPRGIWTMEHFTEQSATPVARKAIRARARARARAMSMDELAASPSLSPIRAYIVTVESLAPLRERLNSSTAGGGLHLPPQDLPSTSYAW